MSNQATQKKPMDLAAINRQVRNIVNGFGIKYKSLSERSLIGHSAVKIKMLEKYPTDFLPEDIEKLKVYFSTLKKEIEVFESLTEQN